MSGSSANTALSSLWNVHRNVVLALGHELLGALPAGEPPITLHGRDLRPADEGTGFQFQYLLRGARDAAEVRAAYYVVQLQLTRRTTSVAWLIDGLPVLDCDGATYRLYHKRAFTVPLHDRAQLRSLLLGELAVDAGYFFDAVRAGQPYDGPFTEIAAGAPVVAV